MAPGVPRRESWSRRGCGSVNAFDRFVLAGRQPPAVRVPTKGDHTPACARRQARRSPLMTPMTKRVAALTVALLAAGGLAACGKSATPSTGGAAAGPPSKPAGTLRIVAASGPDHIDTVPAYYTADYLLERAYARQLLSYPYAVSTSLTSAGWKKSTTPAADVATVVPTTANGGINNGGKTYTFHMQPGVEWNTTPA